MIAHSQDKKDQPEGGVEECSGHQGYCLYLTVALA
jgi:hypothetical protein